MTDTGQITITWVIETTERFTGTFDVEDILEENPGAVVDGKLTDDFDPEWLANFESGEAPYARSVDYAVTERFVED